jgi:lipopolysaccharide transport system ATP-binding protein
MSNTVIKVEGVGKQYRLGQVGTGTIAHDLNRFWAKVRGKEDPNLKVGEVNDQRVKDNGGGFVWALKDINFEIKQGEVLGIIGKNGAGKSTLLKIISRVTNPTVGDIKVKGRIASLLEVGTGFHPDLTGKENIFLNGAILGMTKTEIKSKFDEIVDFSGVERYIDTPVKRYSSGMYVRLAFAVAAHLEPEILIIDEVLAVGDAEFQKKCLGKMKDVAGEGRTVLFVSHNLPSIRVLCNKCLYLDKGTVKSTGNTDSIISEYLARGIDYTSEESGIIPDNLSLHNTGEAKFKKAAVINAKGEKIKQLDFTEKLSVEMEIEVLKDIIDASVGLSIVNQFGETILMSPNNESYKPMSFTSGRHKIIVNFTEELMPGNYSLGLFIANIHTGTSIDSVENFYPFSVSKESVAKNMEYPWNVMHGYIKPKTNWEINKI